MADSRVYFVQGVDGGPIKIGFATNVKTRFQTLQIGSPIKLVLLAHKPGGPQEEWELHHKLKKYQLHGEWFSPAAEVLAEVASAKLFDQEMPRPLKPEKSPERIAQDEDMDNFMRTTFVAALRDTFECRPGWKREIARLAGITEKQVHNWLTKGAIPQFVQLVNLLRNSDDMKMWWLMMVGVTFAALRLKITCAEALEFCAEYPAAGMASHGRGTNEEAWNIIDPLYEEFRAKKARITGENGNTP